MLDRKKDLSRRAFAKQAALAAAAAAAASAGVSVSRVPSALADEPPAPAAKPPAAPTISAQSEAEAKARYQLILARRGSRLSEAQKQEVHRAVLEQQMGLDALRAFPLDNADEPATVLRPRRGRKT
jgi:hypothetical protein